MIPQKQEDNGGAPDVLKLVNPEVPVESPSLAGRPGLVTPAYEMKFLLTEAQAREVEDRVQGRLIPDPHAKSDHGNSYLTTSVYLDTTQLDVFHRVKPYKRRKHRLRRYGQETVIFLERKTKRGERVKKRRTVIPGAELELLLNPMSVTEWPGHWFHRHLLKRRLVPVCRIAYERVALIGGSPQGPLRMTFDRRVRGVFTSEWDVNPLAGGTTILADQVICELKYQHALPPLYKEIIEAMRLTPTPVSKYRTFLRATGHAADRRMADA